MRRHQVLPSRIYNDKVHEGRGILLMFGREKELSVKTEKSVKEIGLSSVGGCTGAVEKYIEGMEVFLLKERM